MGEPCWPGLREKPTQPNLINMPYIATEKKLNYKNQSISTGFSRIKYFKQSINIGNICTLKTVLRIRDFYPGSRIQKQQQKRGVEKFVVISFFCSHKFHKIVNYFIFEMLKKQFGQFFKEL
jgi:hypothetical protein